MTFLSIDTTTKQAKKFVELAETLPFAKIIKEPNTATKKAIEDVKRGKTYKAKSLSKLFTELKK